MLRPGLGRAYGAMHRHTPIARSLLGAVPPPIARRHILLSTPRASHTMAAAFVSRPVAYMAIPVVASFVGFITNWMGVKMLFYPIDYFGVELYRQANCPYGLFGWRRDQKAQTNTLWILLICRSHV
jgi:hypothetical protein